MASACLLFELALNPVAHAVTVNGLLSPGSYGLLDYELGTQGSGTLLVQDANYYTQTLTWANQTIELWLTTTEVGPNPFYVYLQQIYLGGLYFTSTGQDVSTNPPPVLYRPYQAPAVLLGDSWGFYRLGDSVDDGVLYSTAGGVTLTDQSTSVTPSWILVSGQPHLVQEIDSTLTLGGNGSGTVNVTQFESPGDPSTVRTDYNGVISVFGQTQVIETSLSIGGLSD